MKKSVARLTIPYMFGMFLLMAFNFFCVGLFAYLALHGHPFLCLLPLLCTGGRIKEGTDYPGDEHDGTLTSTYVGVATLETAREQIRSTNLEK